ncbi:hypothetical protein DV711_17960 [Motiliproteus coralliicola]|uniref:Uncharacterized protein n=1 Tax=Motiliproteus coralliicola TaxID=2283196 RepID=A0A369WD30_9GAMM|nr:hypothetical protein [Motiliproteus coralliicola]RDE18526.1 hypothetical protein DV711_17960 [Motiliproteus coralliicola]
MTSTPDRHDQRLVVGWYVALIAVPLFVLVLLLNADPYERVQLNQVLELRAKLTAENVGAQVIDFLDSKGGHNLTEQEWLDIQPADAEQFFFMVNSSKYSPALKDLLREALKDDLVTSLEYRQFREQALPALMDPVVRTQFGL